MSSNLLFSLNGFKFFKISKGNEFGASIYFQTVQDFNKNACILVQAVKFPFQNKVRRRTDCNCKELFL